MNLFGCAGQGFCGLIVEMRCAAFGILYLRKNVTEADNLPFFGVFYFKIDIIPVNDGIENTGLYLLGAGSITDRLSKNHIHILLEFFTGRFHNKSPFLNLILHFGNNFIIPIDKMKLRMYNRFKLHFSFIVVLRMITLR